VNTDGFAISRYCDGDTVTFQDYRVDQYSYAYGISCVRNIPSIPLAASMLLANPGVSVAI
jgi:hypothetical protein